ncbi:hypothetical protein ACEE21_14735 [Clostridium baratii]
MSSLERVFIKEFKRAMRNSLVSKNIYKVPLPDEVGSWEVSNSDMYAVRGIPSESAGLYSNLNRSLVKKVPSGVSVRKRKIDLVNRNFAKNSNGDYIYEDVKIPQGSIAVVSKVNLNLPYKYRTSDTGFGYVDFVMNGDTKEFLYYIPKKYLYVTNQTALALSVKNMKNYYGKGYLTWQFGTIYLHVIPYKHTRNYVGTKILKTSHTLNYEKEVKRLVDFWVANNVIPNITLCNTIDEGNLVLKDTSRGYEDYIPIEEFSMVDVETFSNANSEVDCRDR